MSSSSAKDSEANSDGEVKADRLKAGRVPSFARDYPQNEELTRLVQAFQRGDFAEVREHAPKLAKDSEEEEVRAAAIDLRRRLDPHAAAAILWGLGVALLVLLFGYYVGNSH